MTVCGNKQRPPTENKQKLFTQSVLQQGSKPPSPAFGKDSRQAEEWGSIIVGRREGFRCALIGGCLAWEGWGRDNYKGGILCDCLGYTFVFLWLVSSWKQGQKLG